MVARKLTAMSPKQATDFRLEPKGCSDGQVMLELSSSMEFTRETQPLPSSDFSGECCFTSRMRSRLGGIVSQNQLESNADEILCALYLDSYNYITSSCFLEYYILHTIDLTVLYIQDLERYNPFLENVFVRYPYQQSTVNQWFQQTVEQEDGPYRVNILNRRKEIHQENDPYPLLDGKYFPDGLNEDGYRLLYHGTSHEFAVNILEDGIDLTKGAKNQDFSHGNGFYLNNNYEEAKLWAFRRNTKPAFLTYKVPDEAFAGFQQQGINLVNDESEWERITKGFRLNPSRVFLKEMKKVPFIEGPMARVGKIKDRRGQPQKLIRGVNKGSYQLCILSDGLAEIFDSCLFSVVFF